MVEVVWDSPSADSRGSMPIGNGDIGANVWVEPSGDLLLLLSKSDAWDEVSRLSKLGLLRIKLPSVTGFRQELRLADGEIRITAGGVTTRVWIDANQPVVHVEMAGAQPFTTSVAHETWRTQEKTLTGGEIRACWGQLNSPDPLIISPDTVLDGQKNQVVFFHRNPTSVWEKNLRNQGLDALVKPENDPLLHRTFGALVRGENLIQDGKNKLTAAKPATSFSIKVHALTARASAAEDWVKQVTAQADTTERTPLAAARAAHAKWWQAFWNRSWISATENTTKAIPENQHPWRVGVAADGSSKFGGTITDALVVGRAASADEIATLAGKPRAGADTTPKETPLTDGGTVAAWIKPSAGETGRILDKCTPFGHDGMIFDTYPGLSLRLIVGEKIMTQLRLPQGGRVAACRRHRRCRHRQSAHLSERQTRAGRRRHVHRKNRHQRLHAPALGQRLRRPRRVSDQVQRLTFQRGDLDESRAILLRPLPVRRRLPRVGQSLLGAEYAAALLDHACGG